MSNQVSLSFLKWLFWQQKIKQGPQKSLTENTRMVTLCIFHTLKRRIKKKGDKKLSYSIKRGGVKLRVTDHADKRMRQRLGLKNQEQRKKVAGEVCEKYQNFNPSGQKVEILHNNCRWVVKRIRQHALILATVIDDIPDFSMSEWL